MSASDTRGLERYYALCTSDELIALRKELDKECERSAFVFEIRKAFDDIVNKCLVDTRKENFESCKKECVKRLKEYLREG